MVFGVLIQASQKGFLRCRSKPHFALNFPLHAMLGFRLSKVRRACLKSISLGDKIFGFYRVHLPMFRFTLGVKKHRAVILAVNNNLSHLLCCTKLI